MLRRLVMIVALSLGFLGLYGLYSDIKNNRALSHYGVKTQATISKVTQHSVSWYAVVPLPTGYSADITFFTNSERIEVRGIEMPNELFEKAKDGEEVFVQYLPENPGIVQFFGHKKTLWDGLFFTLVMFVLAFRLSQKPTSNT